MSKQRQKGTKWETELLSPLRTLWPYLQRTGSAAFADADFSDPDGVCPYAIEAKNQERIRLPDWMDQAVASAERVDRVPLLIVKRKYKSWQEAYAVMRLGDFVKEEEARL